jgi:2-dehydropantoate 2-reductase
MQKIHNVAILGAGAMGGYFAAQFFDAPDFNTILVADAAHCEKLNRDGLIVNGKTYFIPAVQPEDVKTPMDLIMVGLKHTQLKPMVPTLDKLVGADTVFTTLMNGLESEETIGAVYGMEHVLYAISLGIDAVREGNRITVVHPGKQYFGELKNDVLSPKVLRVQEAYERAGIQFQTPPDMERMLWWKFLINVGINQASAILRAPYAVFQTNRDAQALMEALMEEVVLLAQVKGVALTRQDILDSYSILNSMAAEGKTSMLQDVEAGRKTEVEMFAGKVITLGKELGIPTPVNQTVYYILRALESC